MLRRVYEIEIAYLAWDRSLPSILHSKQFIKLYFTRITKGVASARYLTDAHVCLLLVDATQVRTSLVEASDIIIACLWRIRENLQQWPDTKGIPFFLIRTHEINRVYPVRIDKAYSMTGIKAAISGWLNVSLNDVYGESGIEIVHKGIDRSRFNARVSDKNEISILAMLYGRVKINGEMAGFDEIDHWQMKVADLRVILLGSIEIENNESSEITEFFLRPP